MGDSSDRPRAWPVCAGMKRMFLSRSLVIAATSFLPALAACSTPSPPPVETAPAPAMPAPIASIVGPSASEMHPGAKPLDVHDVALPEGVEREWLQKDADLVWRTRNALPPTSDAAAFFAPF